jgi:hypothetical protein
MLAQIRLVIGDLDAALDTQTPKTSSSARAHEPNPHVWAQIARYPENALA